MRGTLPWLAGFTLSTLPVQAQQVVEIDFAVGRTILDDELNRFMDPYRVAVDWGRSIFYVHDSEEPEGIMAFSLTDGQWLRTISTPTGEGPYEFPRGRQGMAVTPSGGLFVSGFRLIVEFDPGGVAVNSWHPQSLVTSEVCNFGGAPAIPAQGGVVWRGVDGADEYIGRDSPSLVGNRATVAGIATARIACTDDRAYLVTSSPVVGMDSVFVYRRSGGYEAVALPTEGIEGMMECRAQGNQLQRGACRVALYNLFPSLDDRGNLVLLGPDTEVHGVIIAPDTGCYALVRNATKYRHTPVGIRGDSVLVFHNDYLEREVNGRTVTSYRDHANKVSMHPLRRVGGEPCDGVLPPL